MIHRVCKAHRIRGWHLGGIAFCLTSLLAVCCLANESTSVAALSSPENTSLLSAIAKVAGSLLVVVGLMLVLLYAIKRIGIGSSRGRGGSAIVVLETRMVAPRKYIAIVEIADKCLALGITEHNINLLADLGLEVKASLSSQSAAVKPGSAFAGLLKKSMKSWQTTAVPEPGGQTADRKQDRQESP